MLWRVEQTEEHQYDPSKLSISPIMQFNNLFFVNSNRIILFYTHVYKKKAQGR